MTGYFVLHAADSALHSEFGLRVNARSYLTVSFADKILVSYASYRKTVMLILVLVLASLVLVLVLVIVGLILVLAGPVLDKSYSLI